MKFEELGIYKTNDELKKESYLRNRSKILQRRIDKQILNFTGKGMQCSHCKRFDFKNIKSFTNHFRSHNDYKKSSRGGNLAI